MNGSASGRIPTPARPRTRQRPARTLPGQSPSAGRGGGVVPQGNEPVLQIEPLRIFVLGEQVHGEDADLLRDVAGCLQEVEQQKLSQTLAPARQIYGEPPQVRG